MPNLVGIGNSQVPTNAMLGGLAYQDSVGELNIEKIKAKTPDTAVDIFVYDTRKDSDGGAWRHRTQNTSWYNESVSGTRGARKEFPAVAIIVIETYELVIYDGDDPNLPMWMRFEFNQLDSPSANMGKTPFGLGFTNAYPHNNLNLSCVHMLNGHLFIGANRAANTNQLTAAFEVNFITEIMHEYLHYPVTATQVSKWRLVGKVVDRNRTDHQEHPDTRYGSGAGLDEPKFRDVVNDVDMKVLPNAPIDESTGLPKPTIALATDGGVSIIKDDKSTNTVDIYPTGSTAIEAQEIYFTESNNIAFTHDSNWVYFFPIPKQTATSTYYNGIKNFIGRFTDNNREWTTNGMRVNVGTGGFSNFFEDKAIGHTNGLNLIDISNTQKGGLLGYSMQCGIATDFNTGWMQGDIKGAFLSSTGIGTITGGNKISNGSDWSGASSSQSSTPPTGWTGGNGATFKIETGNGAVGNYIRLYNENDGGAGPNSYMYQAITTVVGKKYKYSVTQIHHATISVHIRIGTSAGASNISSNQWTSSSSNTPRQRFGTFTATSTTTYISLGITSGTHNYGVGWDELIVTEMDEDHSWTTIYGSNALHAYGSITKTAVAPDAELVAYSGFSNSNYLFQQYNDALDFTDEMSIMLWVNGWTGSDSLLHRGPGTTRNSKTSFHLYCSYDYNYRITFTTNGSTEQSFEFNQSQRLRGWYQLCYTLSNGVVRGFLNGEEKTMSSTAFTGNIFSQATDRNGLWIGTGPVGGPATTASLALLRLSATAPTAEQIKKAYNDEKHLFHQNAKCTLHGSSDSVTALTYDDHNNIIHAGTSSGRSDFQGLNRINNTTTAVTTMISASNGLIAEQ